MLDFKTKIAIMQQNLPYIRKHLNFTQSELGKLVGVTKMTIINIEKGNYELTLTRYLAIMYILDNYIKPTLSEEDKQILDKMLTSEVVDVELKW